MPKARTPKKPARKKKPAAPKAVTEAAAAAALGVSDRQLRRWKKSPGFPDCSAGHDIEAIRQWRAEHSRKGSDDSNIAVRLRIAREKERLKRERQRRHSESLDLQRKSGELLYRRTWELFGATLLTQLGDLCEQLPDVVSADCCPKCKPKLAARLKDELDAWRANTAEELKHGPATNSA